MNRSSIRLFAMILAVVTVIPAAICHAKGNQDVEDARSTIANLEHAWNTHDMDAFAGQFADDADFVNIEGTRWQGRQAIKDAHAFVHATIFKQSHLTIEDTTIRQLDANVIVARSTWRLEGQTTMKGAAVPSRTGILTNVLVRSGSSWKIAVTQNTDIVN
jgi:uncharacterized protein (TIGR02246 family)